jgi:hypothetical protein
MAQVLELPELAQYDGMPEMQVGAARVAAEFYDEGLLLALGVPELFDQFVFGQNFLNAPPDLPELFVDGWKGRHGGWVFDGR